MSTMALGITLLFIGYSLDLFVWSCRSFKRLWRTAFPETAHAIPTQRNLK